MSLHNEVEFENEICEHLAANGWLYSPNDDGYDRARALFPDDVLAWVQTTQPKAWDAIVKNHGANTSTPGKIASAGQVDEWTFFGRAGRTVTVLVDAGSGASSGL